MSQLGNLIYNENSDSDDYDTDVDEKDFLAILNQFLRSMEKGIRKENRPFGGTLALVNLCSIHNYNVLILDKCKTLPEKELEYLLNTCNIVKSCHVSMSMQEKEFIQKKILTLLN